MAETPKKISELSQIQNISDDDLLLVSDYDNGKCLSKKMTMKQLVQYVVNAIAMTPVIEQKTMDVVEENIEDIYDMLDGVKDDVVLIDGGNAEAK